MSHTSPPPVPQELRSYLALAVEKNQVTTQEILAILEVIGWAEKEEEIDLYLRMVAGAFPILQPYLDGRKEAGKDSVLEAIRPSLQSLLHKDPVLAARIMKRATESNVTLADLRREFPILESTI